MGGDTDGTAELSIGVDDEGDQVVVRVAGELDLTTAPALEAAVDAQLGHRVPATVVVDMAGLAFMDSSGLAVLLRIAGRGPAVHLRSPSEVIRQLLAATGLTDTLVVEP